MPKFGNIVPVLATGVQFTVAIAQLCHDIQVYNFTVMADPNVGEQHIYRK